MKKNFFAWASISENGSKYGQVGDQTSKEVKTGWYYDFGQTHCIRIKNVTKRRKVAEIAKYIATGDSVGYSQDTATRDSFFRLAKSCDWDFSKLKKSLKKCNTDCSSFYATCVNLAYGKEIFPMHSYTGNLIETARKNPKIFNVLSIYDAEKAFKKGDGVIKPNKHVIVNV